MEFTPTQVQEIYGMVQVSCDMDSTCTDRYWKSVEWLRFVGACNSLQHKYKRSIKWFRLAGIWDLFIYMYRRYVKWFRLAETWDLLKYRYRRFRM